MEYKTLKILKISERADQIDPLLSYPRPQLCREAWMSLDGEWNFAFDDEDCGIKEEWYFKESGKQVINVPYSYETKKSGIEEESIHPIVWYWKCIQLSEKYDGEKNLLLHFEGVDYHTDVWVNGRYYGKHDGGYSRFTLNLGKRQSGEQLNICVRVQDSLSEEQTRGKQRWKTENYGCWYVQTTGIWKSVWMETVSDIYVEKIKLTPDIKEKQLKVEFELQGVEQYPGEICVECTVYYNKRKISSGATLLRSAYGCYEISVYDTKVDEWGIALWSPETPNLYDIEIIVRCDDYVSDRVVSYFGMREIQIEGNNILLNGKPLYQKLVLDQGYWKNCGLTPQGDEDILTDIEKVLGMGFNGIRKHQKTECERFLYWCDVKGLLVWCEGPSFYKFSDRSACNFAKEWKAIVQQNYNHPSVIVWTPINESWGIPNIKRDKRQQNFSQMIYYLTKILDPMRPVIVNDGWEHTISDIITLHDYEEDGELMLRKYLQNMQEVLEGKFFHNNYRNAFAEGFSYSGQPVMISEYGGIAFEKSGAEGWGYGKKVEDEAEFVRRFEKLTNGIKQIPGVCGYCYTQLTDVQQEQNGLLTESREYKINPEKIREINEAPAGMFLNKKGY